MSFKRIMQTALKPFIGAIDQGTSSSRFLLFSASGQLLDSHKVPIETQTENGWAEQDPNALLYSVVDCMGHVFRRLQNSNMDVNVVEAIGITNQRETVVAFDFKTGQPLCNAIVWHDTRTAEFVAGQDQMKFIRQTGLPISTYFSAPKMRWMLDNVPSVKEASLDGRLRFSTVDSWLMYKLTGRRTHLTDATNASRTQLFDINTLEWSPELMNFYGIDKNTLPTVVESTSNFGRICSEFPFAGVEIHGCLGDQQAALLGNLCITKGMAKCTFGTGAFFLLCTGTTPPIIPKDSGLIGTVAFTNKTTTYALEGSIASAGSALTFVIDGLGIVRDISELNTLAQEAILANPTCPSGGVFFVPAFSGLLAPYWSTSARGTILGMNANTNRRHVCVSVLEAIAYQTRDLLEQLAHYPKKLLVDGGISESRVAMQTLANITGVVIRRMHMSEASALGAAIAAALGKGIISNVSDLKQTEFDEFYPEPTQFYEQWKRAVKTCIEFK